MLCRKFVPLDKSWLIRMGVLDILYERSTIKTFLDHQVTLGDDLLALRSAAECWSSGGPVDVGESGTLYRFLQYASWKMDLGKTFIRSGTLKDRPITNNPAILTWSQESLLTLDLGTTQWASAAVLCGDERRLPKPPYKLEVTYRAVEHWYDAKRNHVMWEARYDDTIERQAEAFVRMMQGNSADFKPEQAEDFCFAYALCDMTTEAGEAAWPQMAGHESNRLVEMRECLECAKSGAIVQSKDHRVVQAVAMWCALNKKPLKFAHPGAVSKSWPQFWNFLQQYL